MRVGSSVDIAGQAIVPCTERCKTVRFDSKDCLGSIQSLLLVHNSTILEAFG